MASTLATAPTTDTAPAPGAIVSPVRLAHVVLRTSRFKELIAWYKLVFNATPAFEDEGIAFLAYDDEHHRIAFLNMPNLATQQPGVAGVHHVAFTYASLTDLFGNYERLRDLGIVPAWSVNHGPTTSLYYADPDGNQLEFQVDNYETVEEAGEFFFTPEFAANPIGVDFDPEELLARMRAGDDEASLKARPASGPRGVESAPLH